MHLVGQTKNLCKFGPLRMWCERGLIHIEDSRDNSYNSIFVVDALERMRAISEMMRNAREKMKRNKVMSSDEYDRNLKMFEEMIEICRVAQEQGMPTDASARRDLTRRLPKTVLMPGMPGTGRRIHGF